MKIVFTSGSRAGEEISIDLSSPVLIGRSHAATVTLTEPDISGRHIEIGVDTDGVYAICLGGHGFILNGAFFAKGERHVLELGDEVSIGAHVRFLVVENSASASEFIKVKKSVKDLVSAGEIKQAEEALEEFVVREPDNMQAKMLYGSCCLLLGDVEKFRRIYGELVPEMKKRSEEDIGDAVARFKRDKDLQCWRVYCDTLSLVSRIDRLQLEGRNLGVDVADCNQKRDDIGKSLLRVLLVFVVVGIAFCVRGDVPPPGPGMGDFPLHRIGIEFILTSVAAALGGGTVTKWLVKRGWKFEKDVTQEERRDIDQKIEAALPRLIRHSAAMRLYNTLMGDYAGDFLKVPCVFRTHNTLMGDYAGDFQISLESILRIDPELLKDLEGVPIEMIALRLEKELKHTAKMDNVDVKEDCYWASPEEMSEWDDKNWHSPSANGWKEIIELRKIKIQDARRRRRRRLITLIVLLPILLWLAWWLGQNV